MKKQRSQPIIPQQARQSSLIQVSHMQQQTQSRHVDCGHLIKGTRLLCVTHTIVCYRMLSDLVEQTTVQLGHRSVSLGALAWSRKTCSIQCTKSTCCLTVVSHRILRTPPAAGTCTARRATSAIQACRTSSSCAPVTSSGEGRHCVALWLWVGIVHGSNRLISASSRGAGVQVCMHGFPYSLLDQDFSATASVLAQRVQRLSDALQCWCRMARPLY